MQDPAVQTSPDCAASAQELANDAKAIARSSTSHDALMLAIKWCSGAAGATALWCSLWMIMESATPWRDALLHLSLLAMVITVVSLMVYREHRQWRQPSRKLAEILDGCRAGERPIDDLRDVAGGVAPIAAAMQLVLRDLRHQRKITAELEAELGQRVASRTDALERKMSSLRVQATRDALTGLYNRRMLEECLPKMIQDCRTVGSKSGELSVLAIDVDNFKPLNDSLGHAVGDDFLRSVAQILRSGVRECDTAIRTGGDEFVVLLPGCPLPAARSLADRLTLMVQGLAKTIKSPLPPGLSVGAASLSNTMQSLPTEAAVAALLESADKALYLNKGSRKRQAA